MSIKRCSCAHAYQDKRYGRGLRVHNEKQNGGQVCTVCGSEKTAGATGKKGKR